MQTKSQINSATEQLKFQLFFDKGHRPNAEIAFLISQQFGNLPTKVVTLPFDKSCSIQGTVTLELELTAGNPVSTPVFKKSGMDINQLAANQQTQFKKQVNGPMGKPRAQGSRAGGKPQVPFKFWKSGGKKTGRKFGVKLDPQSEAVPELLLQVIPHLEETGKFVRLIFDFQNFLL